MSLYNVAYQLDPVLWCRDALDYHPDEWAQRVMMSSARYVIENVSRQAGKSTMSSALAVHQAVFFDRSLILLVSPTLRQSSEILRKTMAFYDHVDPDHANLIEDQKLSI